MKLFRSLFALAFTEVVREAVSQMVHQHNLKRVNVTTLPRLGAKDTVKETFEGLQQKSREREK